MVGNRFAEQTDGIERIAVRSRDDTDFTLRDYRRFRDRNTEGVGVNGPQSRRQRAQLNAFDAALHDERDRVLEIVVRVLRAIGREDASWRHRFAVHGFNDAELVWSNLDQ